MPSVNPPTRPNRRAPATVQWVTFLVLFCFVVGSVIVGGMSFRSGPNEPIPSALKSSGDASSAAEDSLLRAKEAVKANPKDPFARRTLARAEMEKGDLAEARKSAQEGLALSPSDVLNLELLGRIAAVQGRPLESIQFFGKAVKKKPNDPMLAFELADAYHLLGRDEEAKPQFERVIAMNPNSMEGIRSRLALLTIFMFQKRYGEAKKQAMALYVLAPEDPKLLVKLGEISEKENRPAEALATYERARMKSPEDAELTGHLATLYAAQGKPNEAAALWMELLRKNPKDPEPKLELAVLDTRLGKKDEAKDLLERARKEAEEEKDDALKEKINRALKNL